MSKGSGTFRLPNDTSRIWVVSTGPCFVYGLIPDRDDLLLGAVSTQQLVPIPPKSGVTQIRIKTKPSVEWACTPFSSPSRREDPDPTPVRLPIGQKRPPTLQDEIRRFIRDELSAVADNQGLGTFEEEDDFDVGDDEDIFSPYELPEMQEEAEVTSYSEEPSQPEPPAEVGNEEPEEAPKEKPAPSVPAEQS